MGMLLVVVWIVFGLFFIAFLYARGKKALATFPHIASAQVIYHGQFASGFSTKSWITRNGGARKVLDVIVTDKELWIKGMPIFAAIGNKYDLVHRIQLDNITRITKQGKRIAIDFKSASDENKQIVLITKKPEDFLKAIDLKSQVQ